MGQILPGVPVWSMANDSRWPGLPLVVFPGNVGGKEALSEAMVKVRGTSGRGETWENGLEGGVQGREIKPIAPIEFSDSKTPHVQLRM